MADALNAEEESLLQSALQTAFTPVPLPKQSAAPEQPASAPEPAQEESGPTPAPAVPEHESTEEVWKAEYDAHVAEWRRASAEQREQAERERTRWEEIRKKEREEGKARGSARSDGWESVGGSTSASMVLDTTASTSTAASVGGEAGGEPSVADARDLVSGEGQGRKTKEELEAILPGSHAQARSRFSTPPDAPEVEHKWEDIHSSDPDSLASSYPSLSFPSDPHSPSSSLPHPLPPHAHGHAHHHAHPHHAHEPSHEHTREAPSTTQALFDTSLSPRTRVLALVASLAVNIGLPFINGVMLGFGEIFAKEVLVVWLGWGKRSSSSTQAQERARPGAREGGAGLRTAERR